MRQCLLALAAIIGCVTSTLGDPITPDSTEFGDRLSVTVLHTGDDLVGRSVAYYVREELSRSSRFRLGSDENDIVQILLSTVDPDAAIQQGGRRTAIAVVYTMNNVGGDSPVGHRPAFLTGQVIVCGSDVADVTGRDIVASIDRAFEVFKANESVR